MSSSQSWTATQDAKNNQRSASSAGGVVDQCAKRPRQDRDRRSHVHRRIEPRGRRASDPVPEAGASPEAPPAPLARLRSRPCSADRAAGEDQCRQRVQVGLARELDIERLEPLGCFEQQRLERRCRDWRRTRAARAAAPLARVALDRAARFPPPPTAPATASNAPAPRLTCAAASARSARRVGSADSDTERSRNAAAAARPPRA